MNHLPIRPALLLWAMLSACVHCAEIPPDAVAIRFIDPKGRAVPNVRVGPLGIGSTIGQSPLGFGPSRSATALSDTNGIAVLDYPLSEVGKKVSLYALQAERRLVGTWQLPGEVFGKVVKLELQPACHVTGRATCSVWQDRGLPVARAWVHVRQGDRYVARYGPACPDFEFFLPAGSYQAEVTGQELVPATVALEVPPGRQEQAVGTIDLAPNRLGSLFGMPAPELDRVKDWVEGPPVRLADIRGQYALLHFCHWSPWSPEGEEFLRLMEICDAFDEKDLKVIVLVNYLPSIEQLGPYLEKMGTLFGRAPPCAIAVDGDGGTQKVLGHKEVRIGATFLAYGVFGRYVRSRTLLLGPDGNLIKRCDLMASQRLIAELTESLGVARKTPDWEARLNAVYGLADGEVIKRVPPPFIPERRIFRMQWRAKRDNTHYFGMRPDEGPPVMYIRCEWDGRLHWQGGRSSGVRLGGLLGVRRADLTGPAELLRHALPGDWVVRRGTGLGERHRALEEYLRAEFDLAIRIEERRVEREVIVARGRFELRPLAEARNRDVVHVFTGEAFSEPDGPPFDFRTGTLRQFLLSQQCVGLGLDHVVDETESPDVQIKWLYDPGWNNAPLRVDPAKLDRYLDVIARQTSLSFGRERRITTTWCLDWAR